MCEICNQSGNLIPHSRVKSHPVLQDAFYMPMVAVSEISKNVVNAMKNCGIAYRTCKTLEDEAIAYVSRSHNWTSEQ